MITRWTELFSVLTIRLVFLFLSIFGLLSSNTHIVTKDPWQKAVQSEFGAHAVKKG